MDLLIVLVKTLFFYWMIVLVYRFMGKREVGELSIVDLIVSVLIAELAAMSIEQYDKSIFLSLIPMIVLVLLQIILAKLSLKHPHLRTLLDGNPSIIIEKGKVNYKELVKQRYNLEDLLTQLRAREIKSLEEVDYAILETSGKLSVFQKQKGKTTDGTAEYPIKNTVHGKSIYQKGKTTGRLLPVPSGRDHIYVDHGSGTCLWGGGSQCDTFLS